MSRKGWRAMVSGLGPARQAGAVLAVVAMVLAASLYAIAGPVMAASAVTVPKLLNYPLAADTDITLADGERPLVAVDLTLQAGESRRLIGTVHATMITTTQHDMDDTVTLRCLNAAGAQAGIAATAESGIIPGETKMLRPTMLFTAPSAGVYHCYLAAQTGSTTGPRMTVHKGLTFLQVSAADEVGAHMWQNPPCDSPGTLPGCTYLGEPGGPTQRLLLFDDGSIPSRWAAADSATAIDVTANVELTECGHTASCGGRKHDGDKATVSSHLEVVQLDARGSTCNVFKSSERTDVIGKFVHHYNIAWFQPNVPVLATCRGSRNFLVRVAMRWVSGNSVKIDGTREDPLVHTNAVAVNSNYAPTTSTVPFVLGVSQAAAQNALTAAHLKVGTVTSGGSSAPPGTVLAQNAPAGTVEPVNSPVDLTVSTDPVVPNLIVPNLIGMQPNAAGDAIRAVGLTVGAISQQVDCEDLSTVISQSPTPGAIAPPGSAVNYTYGIAPRNGCGIPN